MSAASTSSGVVGFLGGVVDVDDVVVLVEKNRRRCGVEAEDATVLRPPVLPTAMQRE